MSTNIIKDMEEFHAEMSKYDERQAVPKFPCAPSVEIRELRVSLIEEETQELITALYAQTRDLPVPEMFVHDLARIADGIADSIVVLIGTAIAYGIPLQRVWDEVHRTNMAKLVEPCNSEHERIVGTNIVTCKENKCGGKTYLPRIDIRKRDDGKILKPMGWQPPQIEKLIEAELNGFQTADGGRVEGT